MSTLHTEFHEFREKVWKAFEKLVQEGCEISGELPIVVGEYSLPPNGLRTGGVHTADVTNIAISGIFSDPDYSLFPKKESEKDITVKTNKIRVTVEDWGKFVNGAPIKLELEVEPDILDLQHLSTYISGGWAVYE
jgi:hypothetical protein